ncbi:MAG: hypothetical protein IKN72_00650 [Clostridia bacterium]|nr:hypothetical protein [Clostridia bacterium]
MKKSVFRILCVLLCLLLMLPFSALAAAPVSEKISTCGDGCPFYPTIIVPGLGQSSVIVTDDDGNPVLDRQGNKISAFPAYLQTGPLIKKMLLPTLLTLLTQRDMGFSDAFAGAIDLSFGINSSDLNGKNTGNVKLEEFLYPYSECNDYEREIINTHIPFELYPTDLPADHIYYYSYNSFGNHTDLVDHLIEYIQMVMKQTGHNKVNLVPLSQGSGIVSAMLDYHPETMDWLHKVMFVVPALDGSKIIGDVFNDRITFLNADYLYNGFLEEMTLLDEPTARLIEVLLRIFPDEVLTAALQKGVQHLVENTMIRSTSMWSLCPAADYESAAARYLSSPEMAAIKAQTDRYQQARLHARDNVQKLVERGVQVFDVAEYDISLINVGERWNQQNADFIIQLDSTSMGAVSANVGETLPADYVQKNTHCTNPAHNHISPDRVLDASAGLLPDTTFYFKNQRHDLTQHNDVILKLAMQLIAHDEIKDVYSSPDFPQFNYGRNVKHLRELLEKAEGVNRKLLTKKKAAALDAAVALANETLSKTVDAPDAIPKAEAALTDALVAAGAMRRELTKPNVFAPLSLWLYKHFGPNGYSEMPLLTLQAGYQAVRLFVEGLFSKIA